MKTHTTGFAVAAALLLGCPQGSVAQSYWPTGPGAGERLVVTFVTDLYGPLSRSHRSRVEMDFVAIEGVRLLGATRDRVLSIDTRSILSVKRQIGTKPASAPAMVLGSAAGFAVGFLVGSIAHSDGSGQTTAVGSGLSTGVLLGAPTGALVAWVASRSRPIYEEVRIGPAIPSVSLAPSGRTSVAVSVATP
jgi:hypothetical protein